MKEALTCMCGAVEIYQQTKESYWLPIAQRRVTEMESELVSYSIKLFPSEEL